MTPPVLLVPTQAALASNARPSAVTIQDLCRPRSLPSVGGVAGLLQDQLLVLDRAACRFGSSREQLALALVDERTARSYEREHCLDPRDIGALLAGLLIP